LILLIKFPVSDPRLDALVGRHGEDGYRLYLERLRWPEGMRCPRCGSARLLWMDSRAKHNCRDCRYQFRVTAGTLLHDSHLPLETWLLAVSLIVVSERGYPATRLWRQIGGSYKSAWFVEHRIRAAMANLGRVGPVVALSTVEGGWARVTHEPSADAAPGPPPGWRTLRGAIAGPYRNPSTKYLSAYWNEARWRVFHGRDSNAFRETLVALLNHPPLTYEQLVASDQPTGDRGGTT
jgi:transposase-like protein